MTSVNWENDEDVDFFVEWDKEGWVKLKCSVHGMVAACGRWDLWDLMYYAERHYGEKHVKG